jgi:hydrogenase maturation protease
MSLHQTGFQEVLAMAALLGDYPEHILLVGVQPEELEDYGGSLRPSVRAQLVPAIDAALGWLLDKGVAFRQRDMPLPADQGLHPEQLNLESYEAQRPDEREACRLGDERILRNTRMDFDPKPLDLGKRPMRVNVDSRRRD